MFELEPLKIPGAFVIRGKVFTDDRGSFCKTFHREFFKSHGLEWDFAEQYYSQSKKNVVRGLHFQSPPYDHAKIVHCISGSSLDVLVDLRDYSPAYGSHVYVDLDSKESISVYAPPGLAHGFLSKADNTIMMYSVTSTHSPAHDSGILWNSIDFDWGIENPILSSRDQSFAPLKNFRTPFVR